MNVFRSILITGPPGIGKTSSAHLAAKLTGFTPIELNASDARSKRLVEVGTVSHIQKGARTDVRAVQISRVAPTSAIRPWTGGWPARAM